MRTRVRTTFDHPVWTFKLQLQRWIMFICSVTCTALVFVQVVTRYLFNYSIFGIEEAASFLGVTMYFIGAAYATHERSHISASIVDTMLADGRMKHFVFMLTRIITVLLSVFLLWQMWQLLAFTNQMGTRSVELRLPMLWVYGAMFAGLTLILLYFLIDLYDSVVAFIRNED